MKNFSQLVIILISLKVSLFSDLPLKPMGHYLRLVERYEKNNLHFILEDESCWIVNKMTEKRTQSWSEWWNNQTPMEWDLDSSYFCDPKKWNGAVQVQIYETPCTPFNGYNFVLENVYTKEKIFVKPIFDQKTMIPKTAYIQKYLNSPYEGTKRITFRELSESPVFAIDDKLWKITLFSYNWRSPKQWLKGEEIDQPDECFVFSANEWTENDKVQIYKLKEKNSSLVEITSYLINNKSKGQFAYAEPFNFQELISIFKKQNDKSYQNGFIKGKREGIQEEIERKELTRIRDQDSYYILGYNQGKQDGIEQEAKRQDSLRNNNQRFQPNNNIQRN